MKQHRPRLTKDSSKSNTLLLADSEAADTSKTMAQQPKSKPAVLREQLAQAILDRRKTVTELGKERLAARNELVALICKLLPQYISSFEGREKTSAKDIRQTLRIAPKELTYSRKELKNLPKGSYSHKRLKKTVADLEKALTASAIKGCQLLDKVASDIHSSTLKSTMAQLSTVDKKRKKMILALKFAGQQLESAIEVDKKAPSHKLSEAEEIQARRYTSALRKLRAGSSTE